MLLLHFFTMHSWGELFTRSSQPFAFDFYQIRGHFLIISPMRTPPHYQFKYIVGISRFSINRINIYCSDNIVNIHWQTTLREFWNIDYIIDCLRGHSKDFATEESKLWLFYRKDKTPSLYEFFQHLLKFLGEFVILIIINYFCQRYKEKSNFYEFVNKI